MLLVFKAKELRTSVEWKNSTVWNLLITADQPAHNTAFPGRRPEQLLTTKSVYNGLILYLHKSSCTITVRASETHSERRICHETKLMHLTGQFKPVKTVFPE